MNPARDDFGMGGCTILQSFKTQSCVDDAHRVLEQVFGYSKFRGPQERIVGHVAAGGDALVLMPTGGGKSLCYQIPAIVRDGVGVVVSPLISLMKDQVDALNQLGVRAAYLNSSLPRKAAQTVEQEITAGSLDLLYVAPERLLTDRFLRLLTHSNLALFAIDEAHCVSQWGHDFRPHYLGLSVLYERFPEVPRIALTATADEPTRADIIERLRLETAERFIAGFDRPNICYRVVLKSNPREQMLSFLRQEHRGHAGIVYCLSRRKVEETADWLQKRGWEALPYHAGLSADERRLHQERFILEEGIVIVATVAFGMGIDKPNVRFVAHLDLPRSLESYYQETGRAGRDGLAADAWLAYGMGDVVTLRKMIDRSEADETHKQTERQRLDSMLAFCETATCRRQVLLGYFGENHTSACGNCDTCLVPVETWDGTLASQKALSCIFRTGQRFGVSHLVDVLEGKTSEKVKKWDHHLVSTFGIGSELDATAWRSVFRQLVVLGLASVDHERHGALCLTQDSLPILRGEKSVQLRKDPKPPSSHRGAARRLPEDCQELFGPRERALWETLRAKRLELARSQGIPPYAIFHDATLQEMAIRKPSTIDDLGEIAGVGKRKLARYGEIFLEVLQAHC